MKTEERDITKKIGFLLKERRQQMKISQQKIAAFLGVSFQQVQKYESGVNRLSAAKLAMLCEPLKISINYFYNESFLKETKLPPAEDKLISIYNSLDKKDKKLLMQTIQLLVK